MPNSENLLLKPDFKKIQVRTPYIVFPQTWFAEIHVEATHGSIPIVKDVVEKLSAESGVEEEAEIGSSLVPEFTIVDLQDAFRSPLSTMEP